MAISKYHEFLLQADNVQKDERGIRQFTVQVASTPDGGACGQQLVTVPEPEKLESFIRRLDYRQLKGREIIEFGELLANLLLSGMVRTLFDRNSAQVRKQPGQGLRLRLQLAPALFSVPWEYLYLQREQGEKDRTGFLALDPCISIVRDQTLLGASTFDPSPRARRLLLVMASPQGDGLPDLALEQDRAILSEALGAIAGVTLDPLPDATLEAFARKLQKHTDIVHFAGHGVFKQTGCGESLHSAVGVGKVVFATPGNTPDPVAADVFANNLMGKGVQLVVLGACQTGRTDRENVWSGVVAALMEVGIPAAVAMQFKIRNDNARDFTQSFYQTLAGGHLLDQAISAGRMAIFNRFHANPDDPGWQDWGAPVVYLRQDTDFVLPVTTDDRKDVEIVVGPGTTDSNKNEPRLETHVILVILSERLDLEELRTLCFQIGIDYDDLRGEGKTAKARELITYLERRQRVPELVHALRKYRPDIF